MKRKYIDEYNKITENIINDKDFIITKNDMHHGLTKYDHLINVSKCAFVLAKIFNANVEVTTTGALLHDLFYGGRTDKEENSYLNHPYTASMNAKKYFNVSIEVQRCIETHMFHHVIIKKIFHLLIEKKKQVLNLVNQKVKRLG